MSGIERFKMAAEVFEACRELTARERLAVLRERCGGDEPLRLEVEELLAAHDRENDPLHTGGVRVHDAMPERVGRYTVLERIGAGGMGVVYRASQDAPRREVALKVLPGSLVSASLRARFEHESQALGRLDHPNIAKVYEAGVERDAGGAERPYFAMELIEGRPLNRYGAGLGIPARMELVAKVCDAVQHAHQRGVIHRDLKPSNILVDEAGEPRVLDFGVARLTDAEAGAAHTLTGQVVGTLQYMSPEQASGDSAAVDTRSDVYSLGVILYELLTGRLPHDVSGLAMLSALRRISDTPAAALGDLGTGMQSELATIVGKALVKDPALRYDAASDLGEDLRRALRNEPILAHPPSTVYQLKKFISRNRPLVGLGAVAALALVAGSAALAVGLTRARAAQSLAETRLIEAEAAANKAQAVQNFLTDMLGSVDPAKTADRDITVRDALDAAAVKLRDGDLEDMPGARGTVLWTLGQTYRAVGAPAEAEPALVEAVEILEGSDDAYAHASAVSVLGSLYYDQGKYAESELLQRTALELWEAQPEHGENVPMTMDALGLAVSDQGRPGEAIEIFRDAVRIHTEMFGEESIQVATSTNNVAFAHFGLREFEEAASGFERVLELQENLIEESHPEFTRTLDNLGQTYARLGRHDEAIGLLERSLQLRQERLGDDHPDLFFTHLGLGNTLRGLKRYEEAISHFERGLTINSAAYGDEHLYAAAALYPMGQCLRSLDRFDEAWECFRKTADIRHAHGRYSTAAAAYDAAAYLRQMQGELDTAESELRYVMAYQQEHIPDDTAFEANVKLGWGLLKMRRKDYAGAVEPMAQAVALRREALGSTHGRTGEALSRYGLALLETGDYDGALSALDEAEAILVEAAGDGHWIVASTRAIRGRLALRMDDAECAHALLSQAYGVLAPENRASDEWLGTYCRDLAEACTRLGDADGAARWEALASEHETAAQDIN